MKELNELVELANLANVAGQGSPEMVDFRVTANPDNILAIAAAFRALEQEKEAADRYAERLNTLLDDRDATLSRYEMKLAELEKQEPSCNHHWIRSEGRTASGWLCSKCGDYDGPAPAADLMPGEWTNEQCLEFLSIAFRHAEISGDIEMNDIRLAVKMVNAAAPEVE